MKKLLIILILSFYNLCFSQSDNLIQGRILDEELVPLPGVRIFVNDKLIGETDFDGFYKVKINSDTKIINYDYLGMASTPILVDRNCNYIEVIMRYDAGCYLGYSKRRIERIERRRFIKIEKIHSAAFNQGLFKTQKVCGEIQFKL